ncbi:similar to histidine acid phosphatase [Plenodomus lingam JN3]|uniref:Similar to histidine acid phosphatase n=1 Tax=Leptosphaeria maculans (strain JN3 / isolate v23.1.3 / race Av1-4-5-6-7-8) TaxID=985895 RepID=E4ZS50_LEPMJ|nr:similar to histidine acid phosphatase [Plenodomus lingam JN3]CBX94230.1 similar to histidine acid phosphatase [Plenodomus lingam JN3]
MTTFVPRQPYTQEELDKLYPKELELQLVQIAREVQYLHDSKILALGHTNQDSSQWNQLQWRRRLETFDNNDGPGNIFLLTMPNPFDLPDLLAVIAAGPKGEYDGICQPGELTDQGRSTTFALGQRLRHLYVDQLQFMPSLIADADMIYLRATPIPRALESLQQTFTGFYPPSTRTADFPPPTIITRTPADETLFPNDASCRRFAQLSRAFAARTAQNWNDTDQMSYLTSKISKYMPNQAKVAVDSRPRLSGIMDTINATDAHGPDTKLPKEFYDPKLRATIDKIAVEEWFKGYTESVEYRTLGIGGLMADITSRMAASTRHTSSDGLVEIGTAVGRGRGGETGIKFAMSGCHDTTLAGVLSSLGAFDGEKWPPFTSHIAFELFKVRISTPTTSITSPLQQASLTSTSRSSWWSTLFGTATQPPAHHTTPRTPVSELSSSQREQLKQYYVRIRYNDRIMQVPGCKTQGNHLHGDTTFCTLEAFKSIVDAYTPQNWKAQCGANLDAAAFPEKAEPAGY